MSAAQDAQAMINRLGPLDAWRQAQGEVKTAINELFERARTDVLERRVPHGLTTFDLGVYLALKEERDYLRRRVQELETNL